MGGVGGWWGGGPVVAHLPQRVVRPTKEAELLCQSLWIRDYGVGFRDCFKISCG